MELLAIEFSVNELTVHINKVSLNISTDDDVIY